MTSRPNITSDCHSIGRASWCGAVACLRRWLARLELNQASPSPIRGLTFPNRVTTHNPAQAPPPTPPRSPAIRTPSLAITNSLIAVLLPSAVQGRARAQDCRARRAAEPRSTPLGLVGGVGGRLLPTARYTFLSDLGSQHFDFWTRQALSLGQLVRSSNLRTRTTCCTPALPAQPSPAALQPPPSRARSPSLLSIASSSRPVTRPPSFPTFFFFPSSSRKCWSLALFLSLPFLLSAVLLSLPHSSARPYTPCLTHPSQVSHSLP